VADNDDGLIFWKDLIPMLAKEKRPMAEKYVKFALDEINFPKSEYSCKSSQDRTFCVIKSVKKRRNWKYVKPEDAEQFVNNLKEMSVDLIYADVKQVCEKYSEVLKRSRKRGMRGQRNFTGKVEDEIRGKLSELGTAKFCYEIGKVKFKPDFSILEKGKLRDEGDFVEVIKNGNKITLPTELLIAIKSTAGYFSFGVPQNEWSWPGNVYISVRLHIDESFLLRLLNKGLGLEDFDMSERIGWLEIFGYVYKTEMEERAFVGKRLPGKYHASQNDWNLPNYIMHQMQLHRTRKEFQELMKRYSDLD